MTPPFADDELETDLSETDKKATPAGAAGPHSSEVRLPMAQGPHGVVTRGLEVARVELCLADAGDTVSVPTGQEPAAVDVEEERLTGWHLYDLVIGRYVNGTHRNRPPTDKMREDAGDEFEWRRT